jgi:hypothetical protein
MCFPYSAIDKIRSFLFWGPEMQECRSHFINLLRIIYQLVINKLIMSIFEKSFYHEGARKGGGNKKLRVSQERFMRNIKL